MRGQGKKRRYAEVLRELKAEARELLPPDASDDAARLLPESPWEASMRERRARYAGERKERVARGELEPDEWDPPAAAGGGGGGGALPGGGGGGGGGRGWGGGGCACGVCH